MLNALNIKKLVYGAFTLFVALYFLSVFLAPVDPKTLATYHISELQLRLVAVGIVLPVVGIWACAAYGFVHFKQYALSIKGSPYGAGTNTIANGLGIIVLQLLVSGGLSVITSISAIKTALGGDQGVTMISTALNIGFALCAAVVLYQGAGQLLSTVSKRPATRMFTRSFYLLTLLSVLHLINIVSQYDNGFIAQSIYSYLPLGAALVCVAIPYIVTWNITLLAVKRLYIYHAHAKGKVYKQALSLLTTGLVLIVGSSVLIQLLSTLGGVFANLQLVPILVVLYVLIFAIGFGYLFIAKAATRLKRVEN